MFKVGTLLVLYAKIISLPIVFIWSDSESIDDTSFWILYSNVASNPSFLSFSFKDMLSTSIF